MHSYDEPVYLISVVSKMLNIHPQTLRQYEREGLIKPNRTEGKMRLYSQRDIDRLKLILSLVRDLGVNLAGVEIVLQLKEEIEALQEEMEALKKAQGQIPRNRSVVIKKDTYQLILVPDKEI
ncbi:MULTISPECIES: heat shock protein transcriptional repressor HspR [unclassified Lebetimonas]|jgi:MerR family transcriptional regulator/heat shock protein HspR|uniref:heat shock protein transcriptional repressor HspR n=1 Tax=unclassified Lebetimonas TaxID=2648158 RepID=UPI0004665FC2|nr:MULTISPECIES: helix-turn-helix transcriptional regulator [unclassified Lebetimonas]